MRRLFPLLALTLVGACESPVDSDPASMDGRWTFVASVDAGHPCAIFGELDIEGVSDDFSGLGHLMIALDLFPHSDTVRVTGGAEIVRVGEFNYHRTDETPDRIGGYWTCHGAEGRWQMTRDH